MSEWVMKPKPYVPDLRRLGALCDSNYQRIARLRLLETPGLTVSEFELYRETEYFGRVQIQLLQKARYTETLLLEQTHNGGRWLNNPQMTVRVYHDANMAEVISCYRDRHIAAVNNYPNRFMHHPDEKMQINSFLADWLDFCLRYGHAPLSQSAWSAGDEVL
ncbi:DUF1249 domain-containing protein [Marinobacter sp. X15-166B]|uniref:DUF1249 domain-containing protein n=1 Tax=Marinobacter sp. X15-166B TaxID=1897620 RepID=UPI00085CB809|nr:DUF1249 domain-containing protein [Marinobacter sp. X15-166B]OEY66603.1 hypothetical protein BG841_09150 [Marinobacter sp. X15-166B]